MDKFIEEKLREFEEKIKIKGFKNPDMVANYEELKSFFRTALEEARLEEGEVDKAVANGEEKYAKHFKNGSWGSKGYMTKRQCIIEAICQLGEGKKRDEE